MRLHHSGPVPPRRSRGVSLLELLVVLAIIAVLVGMAATGYTRFVAFTAENRAVANIHTIATAQIAHHALRGRFGSFEQLIDQLELFSGLERGVAGRGGSEVISDGRYDYSLRFDAESAGYTLDADPKPAYASRYRRFRLRMRDTATRRHFGTVLASPPMNASPPDSAYQPLNP
jgi:prepilin-type N-terminal cleavage/methylation domain-containing protein